jgi:hypothetical protein
MLGELREELVECTTPHKTPSASRLLPSPEPPSLGADFLQDGEGDRQERDQMVQKMREDVERLNGLLSNKDILLDQASHDAQVAAEQLTLVQEKAGRAMAMQSAADEKVLGLQQQVAARDEQLATLSQDIQDAAAARAEAQSRLRLPTCARCSAKRRARGSLGSRRWRLSSRAPGKTCSGSSTTPRPRMQPSHRPG